MNESMENQFDAIVIGGGVSGLTAAFELTERGQQVALLAPDNLGGMLLTKKINGFQLEQGPNVILERPEIGQLIDRLGIRSQVVYPVTDAYRQFVWYRGRPVQVPRTALQFFCSRLFSASEKIRIIKALLRPGVFRPQSDSESVLTFFSRGLGGDVVNRVLDPVLKGIYGGEVAKLDAASIFPQLWDAMKRGLSLLGYMKERKKRGILKPRTFVFRDGMETLVRALKQACGEKLNHFSLAAKSVACSPRTFRVTLSDGRELQAPRVILALPLRLALPLLSDSPVFASLAEQAATRRYAPLSVVHCASATRTRLPDDSFGILFPSGTRDHFLGAMVNSALFPHLAPERQALLTLCFGGITADAAALRPSDELVRGLCAEFLGVADVAILARHRWDEAIPQYESGHRQLEATLAQIEEQMPGLFFVSADRGGVGVSDRVKSVMELLRNEK